MSPDSRLLRVELILAVMFVPLLIWLALYLASRWWSLNPRPALPWIKTLRWLAWGFGIALLIVSLAQNAFPRYGLAMTTLSIGLSMPQGWIERRFAPEPLEPERAQSGQ